MFSKQWSAGASVALMLAGLVAVGCDDRSSARSARRASPDASTTQPAPLSDAAAQTASAKQLAGRSADTRPANAYLTVDGRIMEFPSARLRLTRTDEGVRALLFSNDPREAISADYRGNSFYFDVPLKIADPGDIADAEYVYKAPTSETDEDSPNGVFLNGMRTHLQPQDIALTFDGESPKVIAHLAGRFLVVNTAADSTPGQFVPVSGTLFMTAEVKEE